jgi:phosphatidylinositol glycan class O
MVWKVFAPRFMAAAVGTLAVDIAVLLGVGIGVERVGKQVNKTLVAAFPQKSQK